MKLFSVIHLNQRLGFLGIRSLMLINLMGVIAAAVYLIMLLQNYQSHFELVKSPMDTIKQRYINGEISKTDYDMLSRWFG